MEIRKNPYICPRCGENLLARGVACASCNKLLCPVCDCAYTVDYYCYCTECRQMVANRFAVTPVSRYTRGHSSTGGE